MTMARTLARTHSKLQLRSQISLSNQISHLSRQLAAKPLPKEHLSACLLVISERNEMLQGAFVLKAFAGFFKSVMVW